jgi:solute:Na+ symporter, SSS family
VFFGWHLNLDWSTLLPAATAKIAEDKYELFGFFVMMLLFKGVLISAAGPAPNYDMQRVLSAKNPREASMMSAWVNVVLTPPRYFLVIGLTMLAAAFFGPTFAPWDRTRLRTCAADGARQVRPCRSARLPDRRPARRLHG